MTRNKEIIPMYCPTCGYSADISRVTYEKSEAITCHQCRQDGIEDNTLKKVTK